MSFTIDNRTHEQLRILKIDEILRRGKQPTTAKIVEDLKDDGFTASKRTFMRDKEKMVEEYDAPIVSRRAKSEKTGSIFHYWEYSEPSFRLPHQNVEAADLLALQLARELVDAHPGLPDPDRLSELYDHLLLQADEDVSFQHTAPNEHPISFGSGAAEKVDPKIWKAVLEATRRWRTLEVVYRGWTSKPDPKRPRRINPYHLLCLKGVWYLLGSAGPKDPSVRQYRLSRIQRVRVTKSTFMPPEDFVPTKYDHNTFGRFVGDPGILVDVTVRLSPEVRRLADQEILHPKEKRRQLKDKSLEITFPASPVGPWPFFHVISWVLSWGKYCEVIRPPKLRELVADHVSTLHDLYASSSSGPQTSRTAK